MKGRFNPKSHSSFNPSKDYYQILGVAQQASKEEIGTAYKKLSFRSHPDTSDADIQLMQDLNEAHSVLSDPDTRQQYDSSRQSESAKPKLTLILTDAPALQPSENANMSIVVREAISFKEKVLVGKLSVATLIAWAKSNKAIALEIYDDDELAEYVGGHMVALAESYRDIAIKTLANNKFKSIFSLAMLLKLRKQFGNEIFTDALPYHCERLASYDFLTTLQGNLEGQAETIYQHLNIFMYTQDKVHIGEASLLIAKSLCERSYWRENSLQYYLVSLGTAHREIALLLLSDAEFSQFISAWDLKKLGNAHGDSIFNDACAEIKKKWHDYHQSHKEQREIAYTHAPHAPVPVPPPTAGEDELKQYLLSQNGDQILSLGIQDVGYAWIICAAPALIDKLGYRLYELGVAHEEIARFLMSPLNQAAWSAIRRFEDKLWKTHKSACMLAIQSADFKEQVTGELLSTLANDHGEEVRAAIEADPDLSKKYCAYLLLANATQIGHSILSRESSSTTRVDAAAESFRMGQVFERQRKGTVAWKYYYAAAQQGSVNGLAGLQRLINQSPSPAQHKIWYQVKIAGIYADPSNGLHNESLAREGIKALVGTNIIPPGILTDPHLFLLSPYFDKDGIELYKLAEKVPSVCELISKHEHLANLFKGRQFARLGRFDGVQARYISEPLTAYRRLIALADDVPDTDMPEGDDLVNQLQLAGLNVAELSKLGRRFFPIALAIYDNDLIDKPELFLVEVALQHEKVRADEKLLIEFGQKLQAHSHNSLAALLYARAAKNGSQKALDKLDALNKKCDNHFAMLLVICYSDLECRFKNNEKAKWWIGRARKTDLKVVQDYFPLLISLTLQQQHSLLWNQFSAPLAQLEKLPAHVSIKRIFYQGLISVFMQKDVKSRLGDKLWGLLIYAEDIEKACAGSREQPDLSGDCRRRFKK